MAESATKVPVRTEKTEPSGQAGAEQPQRPFQALRRGVDQFLEDFELDFVRSPFRRSPFDSGPLRRRQLSWAMTPAVDIVEGDKAYEVTADLPGYDDKNVEVKVGAGRLTIKGEVQAETEENKPDYHLRERYAGSFERSFGIPQGVDADRIEASFRKGVLTVTLPKKPGAQGPAKKVKVKGG
jgi:HSP20 family protein